MASTVRSIVGDAIQNRLNDPRIATMSSVTRVEMSGDLQIAKVFISVYGGDAVERRTLAGLRHARGRIQGFVARSLNTRHCPEIRLALDDVLRRTNETLDIIARTSEAGSDASSLPTVHTVEEQVRQQNAAVE